MNRVEALKVLAESRSDEVVLMTMSATREWPHLSPSALNFPVIGAMGYASSIGLGIALASSGKRVIVLDGDGSLLMNLGTLVTIANQSPENLIHVVLENGVYEIPGEITLPGSVRTSICGFARAAGLGKVYEFDNPEEFREQVPGILRQKGPVLVSLKVTPGPKEPLTLPNSFVSLRQAIHDFPATIRGASPQPRRHNLIPEGRRAISDRGKALCEELKRAGIYHIAWLPDSETHFMHDAMLADPEIKVVQVCKEGEALAICAGLCMGGEKGAVLMEDQGMFETGCILDWALAMRVPMLLMVGYLFYRSRKRPTHVLGYTEPFLDAFRLKHYLVEADEDVGKVASACEEAWQTRRPVALLLTCADGFIPGT